MRTLPVTVLAWEGPMARAYLVRMARAGLRPARIILMVKPSIAGTRWGRWTQERSHLFHPQRIRAQHPALVSAIAGAMSPIVEDAAGWLREIYDGFSYERYTDRFETIAARSYKDPAVASALRAAAPGTALFTGGGIVPTDLFAIPGLRIIHVHTGLLPQVRGADVLLWSLLTRGRPGVSAFFMSANLDEGDVIASRECPPLEIALPEDRPDDDTLYRSVFSFIDPLIRAELLVKDVLEPHPDVTTVAGVPQDLHQGTTFHFMHPALRRRALRMLFRSGMPKAPPRAAAAAMSSAGYQRYYDARSALATARFTLDALRAPTRLRSLSLRNRRADYAALSRHPERQALHAEFNRQLSLQAEKWDGYDYGEGWFYQSSRELGVTGLRDTAARVAAFNLAELVRDRSVVEIGCNTGFLSLAMAPTARHVVAFEPNPYLIAIARAGQAFLNRSNVEFSVCDFEDFTSNESFDMVISFANHHTYDGRMRLGLESYFARCHELLNPGGRLIFESHPPELEGNGFGHTLAIIERLFTVEHAAVHNYGTFLDRNRRFLVAMRRG
jgi:SAM-dependent methyltransferase